MPYLDTALRRVVPLDPQGLSGTTLANPLPGRQNHRLSAREVEIIDWVRMGKTNLEIASILEISIYTIKNHLRKIFKKLDAGNRTQVVSKFSQIPSLVEFNPALSRSNLQTPL